MQKNAQLLVERLKGLVEDAELPGKMRGAVEELVRGLQESANATSAGLAAALDKFREERLEPMARQYLSDERADRLLGALQEITAHAKAAEEDPPARNSLARRLSKRLSSARPSAHASAKETATWQALESVGADSEKAAEPTVPEEIPLAVVVEPAPVSGREAETPALPAAVQRERPKLQWAARLQTGYEGNLTADQAADLAELRELMLAGEYADDVKRWRDGPDRLLLRFLRAECNSKRKFNVAKSLRRLEKTLQWRRDYNIDDLLDNPPPEYKLFKDIGGETDVIDSEGRVVYFEFTALLANHMQINALTPEQWKRCIAMLTEQRMAVLREQSKKAGHEISALVAVYDLRGGIGLGARRMLPFIKMINAVAAAHYPEMVDIIYVCACPKVFNFLFGLIQAFLDPVTKEKVRIYSSSKAQNRKFLDDLRSHVPLEVLPREYGGEADIVCPLPLHAAQRGVPRPPPFAL